MAAMTARSLPMPHLSVVLSSAPGPRDWALPSDLAARIAALSPAPKHRTLAAILSSSLPGVRFELRHMVPGMIYRVGRLMEASGTVIADRQPLKWLEAELTRVQKSSLNPNAWRIHYDGLRASGIYRTAYRITPLYFSGRCGSAPTDYWQTVVHLEQEYPAAELPYVSDPQHLDIYSESPDESKPPIGAAVYRLQETQHLGEFLRRAAILYRQQHAVRIQEASKQSVGVTEFGTDGRVARSYVTSAAEAFEMCEHPGLAKLQRWFQDWSESSARDTPVETQWRFELREGVWRDQAFCDATPQPVTRRALPRSSKARLHNDPELRDWIGHFDRRAGHPMAWYFFMLHGNWITDRIGERVLESLSRGTIDLPDLDRSVLQRWGERPYGF
jgi:hypothetical protein